MSGVVIPRYAALVTAGTIEDDPAQRAVAAKLDTLASALAAPPPRPGGLFGLVARRQPPPRPRGLYIHGAVGRGKSMLMDLFHAGLAAPKKRRVHFHDFMRDVHARVHAHRKALAAGQTKQGDPIPPVADALARETDVLCFDEFAVTDIADAMILGRLFEALFARGVVVIATSNVRPDDLYRDGLKRDDILPFIALLKARMDVVELASRTDFRREKLAGAPVWLVPLDAGTSATFEAAWARVAGAEAPAELAFLGRVLRVERAGMGAARFAASELIERPLGAADFHAIAEQFHTVFVDGLRAIPALERNWAKRFVTLIDMLYDHRVKLVVAAAVEVDALYPDGTGREAFEMERCVSRLIEMRSDDYLALAHLARTDDRELKIVET